MFQLLGFDLTDVLMYKQARVSIRDNNGLVVVSGQNLDGNMKGITNGVGKSALFSVIPNVRFESTPLAVKKNSKKDILDSKTSCAGFEFLHNDRHHRVEQYGSKYRLLIDGVDQKIARLEPVRQLMDAVWPCTASEFYATSYIQTQRPLAFQKCTESERLKFVTDLFNLHVYDQIRVYVNKQRQELAQVETEFQTFASELQRIEAALKDKRFASIDADRKAVTKSKSTISTLQDNLTRLYKNLGYARRYAQSQEELDALDRKWQKYSSLTESQDQVSAMIRELDQHEQQQERYEAHQRKLEKFRAVVAGKKRPDLKGSHRELQQLREKYDTLADRHRENRSILRDREALQRTFDETQDEYLEVLKDLGITGRDLTSDDLSDKISELKTQVAVAKRLHDHDGETCPTCGSKIEIARIKRRAAKAKEQLETLSMTVRAQDLKAAVKSLQAKLKNTQAVVDLTPKIEKLREQMAAVEQRIENSSELENAFQRLDALEAVKVKKSVCNIKRTKSELEELYEQLDRRDRIRASRKKARQELEDLAKHKTLDVESIESEIKGIEDQLSTLAEKNQERAITVREYDNLVSERTRFQERLEERQDSMSRRKVYDSLYKVYSPTHLKLSAAQSAMKNLENALNTYAPLLFFTPVEFSIDTSKQGIVARCKRNGRTGDISTLSGSETNLFRLLFATSILPIMPQERRTNFIVLDEPDSACGEVVRNRMINEFLPVLRTVVPHVFWITPKSTDAFGAANELQVVLRKGVSSVKQIR